jgi:hypothetical protein
MAETEPESNELPVIPTVSAPCRHLRTKGMYVYSDGLAEGLGDEEDDHAVSWCLQTMKNFGPDDDLVGGRACRDPSRSCYEPL